MIYYVVLVCLFYMFKCENIYEKICYSRSLKEDGQTQNVIESRKTSDKKRKESVEKFERQNSEIKTPSERENTEQKTENREENRKRKRTRERVFYEVEETETYEELVVLTENHDCATPLLSTCIKLLRFIVVFLFPILLVFSSTQLCEEL